MKNYTLHRTGETVTSKDGEWPTQYANRTQAERAAAKIEGAEVIQRGRPFYVRLPVPLPVSDALRLMQAHKDRADTLRGEVCRLISWSYCPESMARELLKLLDADNAAIDAIQNDAKTEAV
jgi:hypothetical protein